MRRYAVGIVDQTAILPNVLSICLAFAALIAQGVRIIASFHRIDNQDGTSGSSRTIQVQGNQGNVISFQANRNLRDFYLCLENYKFRDSLLAIASNGHGKLHREDPPFYFIHNFAGRFLKPAGCGINPVK
jgi:hypothetical protein